MAGPDIAQMIKAAESGLTKAQTSNLFGFTRYEINNAVTNYGIKFKAGYTAGNQYNFKPQTSPEERPELRSPYKYTSEKTRHEQYKEFLTSTKCKREKAEITYGFAVHEFEVQQYLKNKRMAVPGFRSRFASAPSRT